jgi:antitoxin VapB
MALNIKNAEVERLAAEVAEMAHETKTEAIRKALEERKYSLQIRPPVKRKKRNLTEYLEKHVWPFIPPERLGKRITKEEVEEILGIGPEGY